MSRTRSIRGKVTLVLSNDNHAISSEEEEEVQRELLHDLPDWLQECSLNLVDESVLAEPLRHPLPRHRDTSSFFS